jgi:hypothetical protein
MFPHAESRMRCCNLLKDRVGSAILGGPLGVAGL